MSLSKWRDSLGAGLRLLEPNLDYSAVIPSQGILPHWEIYQCRMILCPSGYTLLDIPWWCFLEQDLFILIGVKVFPKAVGIPTVIGRKEIRDGK